MDTKIAEFIQLCEWDTANFLIFSENVFGLLVYYSHLLPLIASLLLAVFIFIKNPKLLAARWLLVTVSLLAVWLFSDLVLWATEKPSYTMFFWSLLVLIEPMIYAGMLFFSYALIDGKDISFKKKLLIFGLLLPTVILTPTHFALTYFDLSNCYREAIEGPLAFYGYGVEIFLALWILAFGIRSFLRKESKDERNKVVLVTVGVGFFLLSFAMGNVIGSLMVDWVIGQYGLFGIPIFVALLSYLIVRYNVFNIKVLSTQFLVASFWLLMLAVLFLRKIETVQIVVLVTLILFTFLGYLLIKSVKREVKQREEIENLAQDLSIANSKLEILNQQKSEFLSIASHQFRAPLTAIKGYASLLLEDTYGKLGDKIREPVDRIYQSVQSLTLVVEDFLNLSRIEQGRMKYEFETVCIDGFVKQAVEELLPMAQKKNLKLTISVHDKDCFALIDRGKFKQVVTNIIDNAIKYTQHGGITVTLSRQASNARILVKDTGIGISKENIAKLFAQFSRATNANQTNVSGTGLGLYIAKKIVEAHKGKVWVESEGEGKGSEFYIELPISKS